MTYSLADLKSFDIQQICQFVRDARCEDETLYSAWNGTAHPETLFIDFYDDIMVDLYTEEDKARLLKTFQDEGHLEDEHMHLSDLDEVLEEYPHLKEDCGEESIEFYPHLRDQFDIYMFKWLLSSEGWGDEFLLNFANGILE
jgi:hypothetical protein